MELAYRQAAAKRKSSAFASDSRNAEKRRMTQLIVSIALFAIVFLSREAFPKFCSNLDGIIAKDVSYSEAIAKIKGNITEEGGLASALKNLNIPPLGNDVPEVSADLEDGSNASAYELVEITPLSRMQQVGLAYYREHGLREYADVEGETTSTTDTPEPEIVTAVAQPYNSRGEALPRNVSYQYYELGLEKTVVPVMGEVTSGFDYRISPISGQKEFHLALDIAAAKGTEIAAFADGVVRYIGESDDFGMYLMIDHANGVATFYAHCSKLLVRKGEAVTCGQTVALVGDTGNATGYHLHFTIEKDNIRLDPAYYVDPES